MPKDRAADAAPAKAFELEQHGFDYIPTTERTMTMREANVFMISVQANFVPVALGVVGVTLGLNLWLAVLAAILGSTLYAYVAYSCISGPRSGLPTLTFTRAPFGMRGNKPNTALTWAVLVIFEGINTILGAYALVALLPMIGINPSLTAKIICALAVIVVSAVLATYGHATIVYAQKIFTWVLAGCLILTFVFTVGHAQVHPSGYQPLDRGAMWAAFFVAISVNAANAISYLYIAPDWFRYMPANTSGRKLFGNLFASGGLTAAFLAALGAVLASQGDMSNPVAGVQPMVPQWLFVIFAISAVGGTIANNIPTLYSSGLNLQALGLPLRRHWATLINVVLATALVIYVLINENFLTALNDFVAMLIVWAGPFGGVWIADAVLRHNKYDPVGLHAVEDRDRGPYWGWRGWNLHGWAAMLGGVVISLLTVNAPVFEGPIAKVLHGADFSWLLGFWVAAALYVVLAGRAVRAAADKIDPALLAAAEAHASIGQDATLAREHHLSANGHHADPADTTPSPTQQAPTP
jgi:nucleobase:cation symporter-1, NCS1 family